MVGVKEDFDALLEASNDLATCAEELDAEVRDLERTVTSDSPWGSDEPGTLFGAAYTATLSHAIDALGSHVERMFDAAERLATWSDNSRVTEEENEQLASEPAAHG